MDIETLNGILRWQAWERAKAELQSILVSYVDDQDRFVMMEDKVNEFIKFVEYNGLQE